MKVQGEGKHQNLWSVVVEKKISELKLTKHIALSKAKWQKRIQVTNPN